MPALNPTRAFIHPGVSLTRGPRTPWFGLLAAALLCANTCALAQDATTAWSDFGVTRDGAVWAFRRASVAVVNGFVVADVQRRAEQTTAYQAQVPLVHCGKQRGDVALYDLNSGERVAAAIFTAGVDSLPMAIANALCNAARPARSMT